MYNKGDTSFRTRPKFMSTEIATAMLARISEYAVRHEIPRVALALHGGEPLLVGHEWARWFLEESARVSARSGVQFALAMQTNGTLLDSAWVEQVPGRHDVRVGVSCDGPPEVHDRYRVDHADRGSYADVRRGIERLADTYPGGGASSPWPTRRCRGALCCGTSRTSV